MSPPILVFVKDKNSLFQDAKTFPFFDLTFIGKSFLGFLSLKKVDVNQKNY